MHISSRPLHIVSAAAAPEAVAVKGDAPEASNLEAKAILRYVRGSPNKVAISVFDKIYLDSFSQEWCSLEIAGSSFETGFALQPLFLFLNSACISVINFRSCVSWSDEKSFGSD